MAMRQVAAVSLGLAPPTSSKSYKSTAERTNTVSETVCVYDAVQGTKLASHRLEGACAGLAANEKSIITTRSGKATTAVFAWGRESPISRFAAPEQLGPIAFTHDGIHIVAGGVSGTVYVWEASTGQLLCAWKAHYRKVLAVKFTDDDAVLVTAGDDAMVHLWDFAAALYNDAFPERSLIRTVAASKTGVTGLACGSGGISCKVATSSMDHTCRVFVAASGSETFCAMFPASLLCVLMDIGETQVFCGSTDGSVHVGELSTGKTFTLAGHEAAVTCLATMLPAVSSNAFMLLSGSDDGTLRWWDTISKSPLKTVRIEGSCPIREVYLVEVEINKSGTTASSGKGSRDQQTLKKLKEIDSQDRWVTCISESEWERRDRLENFSQSQQAGSAVAPAPHPQDPQLEAKWLSVANRLYAIAAESVVNKLNS